MTEQEFLKRLKIYKGIVVTLITLLFGAIGYSYSLKLDIDYLKLKQKYLLGKVDVLENSYIKYLRETIWKLQEQ